MTPAQPGSVGQNSLALLAEDVGVSMNDRVPAEFHAALQEAVTPTRADVLAAKQVVLGALADGAQSTTALTSRMRQHDAIPRTSADERLHLPADAEPADVVRRDVPGLARLRSERAVRRALAELQAAGALIPVTRTDAHESIAAESRGWSGSYQVPLVDLDLASGYALADSSGTPFELLDTDIYTAGMTGLLGARGVRCVDEALRAHRRGLHLAAVNMLGAASEAAWYSLGERLRAESSALARKLEEESTAGVIRLVTEVLMQRKERWAPREALDELRAHAAHLRNLRNYGAHPRGQVSGSLEPHFTEHGAALLFMSSHRYFGALAAVAERATAPTTGSDGQPTAVIAADCP